MRTEVAITLTPKFNSLPPKVIVAVPGTTLHQELKEPTRIELDFDNSVGWLEVVFSNKPDNNPDMAVIIDQVEFFGISDPKFAWAGIYTPQYPEPWYSQQTPLPAKELAQQTYLGWNGCWRLDFSVPVFTWMHQTLNLGWIYQ